MSGFATKCEAERYVGKLSKPEKMPCPSWNLEPLRCCPSGRQLAKNPASVCRSCYGTQKSSRYVRFAKTMRPAWNKRYEATQKERFEDAMVRLISDCEFFRWHDTGDVYDEAYWHRIVSICEQTPDTKHWLPTKEYWIAKKDWPDNLCVRFSAPFVGSLQAEVDRLQGMFGYISTVSIWDNGRPSAGCRASHIESRSGKGKALACVDCRDCWGVSVPVVDYNLHGK